MTQDQCAGPTQPDNEPAGQRNALRLRSESWPKSGLGRAEEVVAAAVRFLATPAAGYVTAETIRVGGGQTAIGAIGSPGRTGDVD
jgi:hypothetical protein